MRIKDIFQSLLLGILAASSIFISIKLKIPAWVLFIGWASHDLFCSNKFQTYYLTIVQEIIGLVLAITIVLLGQIMGNVLNGFSMVISVFLVVVPLFFVTKTKKFNNLTAYFLGMTVWFGVGGSPSFYNLYFLTSTLLLGYTFALTYKLVNSKIVSVADQLDKGPKKLERRASGYFDRF
jgi:hypothetical protein